MLLLINLWCNFFYIPFLCQMDVVALLTKRQYPSIRSAILSATSNEGHVMVSSSDDPATLSCREAFDWFEDANPDAGSQELVDGGTSTVWIDWMWLKSAICVACEQIEN